MLENLNQEGKANSENYQAVNMTFNGITYQSAHDIAMDVFNSNILHFKQEAKQIAEDRAKKITKKFITKILNKNPELVNNFRTPSLQDDLFNVQKAYAKLEDEQLSDLLVELLVERTQENERNYKQIIYIEALDVVQKLTAAQIDAITINFIVIYLEINFVRKGVTSNFTSIVIETLKPFTNHIHTNKHYYEHSGIFSYLEYCGCGYIREGSYDLFEDRLLKTYSYHYQKNIPIRDFEEIAGPATEYDFIEVKNDGANEVRFRCNQATLNILLKGTTMLPNNVTKTYNAAQRNSIMYLFDSFKLSSGEVKQQFINESPDFVNLINFWNNTKIRSTQLTDVAKAIAISNLNTKLNLDIDFSRYIRP